MLVIGTVVDDVVEIDKEVVIVAKIILINIHLYQNWKTINQCTNTKQKKKEKSLVQSYILSF